MKNLVISFFLTTMLFIQAGGQAVSIPIVDADFESQAITGYVQTITDPAGCGADEQGLIAGWVFEHVNPGSGGGVAHWTCDDGMPNSNVAFLGSGSRMYQMTAAKARRGVYVLQADAAGWFYFYPGDLKLELYQGTADASGNVALSPAPFCSQSIWGLGDMNRLTVVCPLSGYFLQTTSPDPLSVGGQNPGGNVVVLFENGVANPALGGHAGWPILIDNVSLSFSPQ